MILGLSSYTYGWAVGVRGCEPVQPLDENGLLDRCRDHGVAVLQIGDNLPLHTFGEARLDELSNRAGRDGMRLEIGARGLKLDRITEYAAIARRLGARLIRMVIDDADYHPDPATVTAILREAVPLLEGLTLGIENHDRFSAATLRNLIEAAGSDRIGICLDTANSLGAGEGIEAVAAVLGPFTVNLHLKDFHIARVPHQMGFTVEGRPAGEGMLNIPALRDQLARWNRCETAVLELWTPPAPNPDETIVREAAWAARSIRYLKPLFDSAPRKAGD